MRIPPWRRLTPEERAARFWRWWPRVRDGLHASIEAGDPGPDLRALQRRVAALDPRLGWEVGEGSPSRHLLTLRPGGIPTLRELALAWFEQAPRPDGRWAFAPARPPARSLLVVPLQDRVVDTAELAAVATWNVDRETASVLAWHSAFESLDPGLAYAIAREALNDLFGDDDLERWIGSLAIDVEAAAGPDLHGLRAFVDHHAAEATRDRWVTRRRQDQHGRPVAIRFNAALKRIDHPLAHDIVAVDLPRDLDPVDAPEAPATIAAIRDLARELGEGATRASEISEPRRLTVNFVTGDGPGAVRLAERWSTGHKGLWAEARVLPGRDWVTFGHGPDEDGTEGLSSAVTFKTERSSNRLDRRARWIRRHPWRLISGPLAVGFGAIVFGAVVPAAGTTAAILFISAFGIGGLAASLYLFAGQYLDIREHPALGCAWFVIEGWRSFVVLGVSLLALFVVVAWIGSGQ